MKSSQAVQPAVSPETSRQHRRPQMGVGEPSSNYSKVPNELDYLYTGNKLSGLIQAQIVWFLIRETWGHESRREWAPVSVRKMAQLCGAADNAGMTRAFKDLVKRQIIAVKEGRGCTSLKLYKLTVENWKEAPAYEPTVQMYGDEATPDEDDDPEPLDDPARPEHYGGSLVVRPNRKARVMPARIQLKDREPVDFRIRYANTCSHSMQVSAVAKADLLLITFREPEPEANKRHITADYSPNISSQVIENTDTSKYALAVRELCVNVWSKAADAKLIAAVTKAAGAAPVEIFQRIADKKLSGRNAGRQHSTGLLIELAKDAARAHEAIKDLPKAEQPREVPALPPPPPLDPTIAWDIVRSQLQAICSEITYQNWFARTHQISANKSSMVVAVPDQGTKDILESDDDLKKRLTEACSYKNQPTKITWKVQP